MRADDDAANATVSQIVPRIAVVGRDAGTARHCARDLRRRYTVAVLDAPERGDRVAGSERYDVVVLATNFAAADGPGLLRAAVRARPGGEIIVYSTEVTPELVVAAMRLGATDFLCDPVDAGDALSGRIALALERSDAARARAAAAPPSAVDMLVGESPAMHKVRKLIVRLGDSNLPVLILGRSGTGKELAARALHAASSRAAAPFVAINCAGLSESLIDSELFGHERGAFTGAQTSHKGLFDSADGGTLFLDEIGDMPPQTQVRLLRTLQEGEVRPVGATRTHHVDVRVVSATHADMARAVAAGDFREDLYFRLSTIMIELPPLRDRGRDVLLLAERLLATSAARAKRPVPRISQPVLDALVRYDWPGNVRELKSAIEYALSLARGEAIEMEDLPPSISGDPRRRSDAFTPVAPAAAPPPPNYVQERRQCLTEFDRRYFTQLLRSTKGNLSEASRHSGVDRANLRRILKEIGLDVTDYRPV